MSDKFDSENIHPYLECALGGIAGFLSMPVIRHWFNTNIVRIQPEFLYLTIASIVFVTLIVLGIFLGYALTMETAKLFRSETTGHAIALTIMLAILIPVGYLAFTYVPCHWC